MFDFTKTMEEYKDLVEKGAVTVPTNMDVDGKVRFSFYGFDFRDIKEQPKIKVCTRNDIIYIYAHEWGNKFITFNRNDTSINILPVDEVPKSVLVIFNSMDYDTARCFANSSKHPGVIETNIGIYNSETYNKFIKLISLTSNK